MTSRIPISLSLLLLTRLGAGAQTADDFFHGGAQSYLTNNVPGALEVVTNGLQRFPADEKLKKLFELLNQQQQQQQKEQQQKEQDQKDQQKQDQKQDQQKQDKKEDEQSKQDQQKKEDKKQQEGQDKKPKEQKDKDQAKPDDGKESGKPQQVSAHAMTPKEAKQLLDAQKDDEQVLIFQPQGEPKNRTKRLKDW